ncbi:hypothetical protein CUTER_10100 [Corynebacterium uterequi]|uniref:Uncharacterized protein n=2 Tax=Corynebacterium uterequi TaxID=1072256 RepID=A0A0G3HJ55_9CORY|nr:hypothetical protein CUTER_10100 [Corynebacterium uterequi]
MVAHRRTTPSSRVMPSSHATVLLHHLLPDGRLSVTCLESDVAHLTNGTVAVSIHRGALDDDLHVHFASVAVVGELAWEPGTGGGTRTGSITPSTVDLTWPGGSVSIDPSEIDTTVRACGAREASQLVRDLGQEWVESLATSVRVGLAPGTVVSELQLPPAAGMQHRTWVADVDVEGVVVMCCSDTRLATVLVELPTPACHAWLNRR